MMNKISATSLFTLFIYKVTKRPTSNVKKKKYSKDPKNVWK